MYDMYIKGTQKYAAQFWDINSGKTWFNFLEPNIIRVGTYILNANDEVKWDNVRAVALDCNGNEFLSGNLTAWYDDAGVGYGTYQIGENATTPTNTNYTVWYGQNNTGSFTLIGVYTGNNTIALSPRYQNTDVRIVLNGNQTSTPELISITFYTKLQE